MQFSVKYNKANTLRNQSHDSYLFVQCVYLVCIKCTRVGICLPLVHHANSVYLYINFMCNKLQLSLKTKKYWNKIYLKLDEQCMNIRFLKIKEFGMCITKIIC